MSDMRRETLKGDVRAFLWDRIKDHLGDSLKESEQRAMLHEIDNHAAWLISQCIDVVAGDGAQTVKFELSNPVHKQNSDGSYIEAKVKTPFTADAWMACGLASHVVGRMVCPAHLYGEAEKISDMITPDQHEMYDEQPAQEHANDGPSEADIAAASEMSDAEKILTTIEIMVLPGPLLKGTKEFPWEQMDDETYQGARWGWAAHMCGILEKASVAAFRDQYGKPPNATVAKGIKLGIQGRAQFEQMREKKKLPETQNAAADNEMPEIPPFLRREVQAEPAKKDSGRQKEAEPVNSDDSPPIPDGAEEMELADD